VAKLQEKYMLGEVEVLRNRLEELCMEDKKLDQQSHETDRTPNDASDNGNSAAMDSIDIDERDSVAIDQARGLIQEQTAIIESLKTELNILLEAAVQRSLTKEVCPDLHATFIFMDRFKERTWEQLKERIFLSSSALAQKDAKETRSFQSETGTYAWYRKFILRNRYDSGLSTAKQWHILNVMLAHKILGPHGTRIGKLYGGTESS